MMLFFLSFSFLIYKKDNKNSYNTGCFKGINVLLCNMPVTVPSTEQHSISLASINVSRFVFLYSSSIKAISWTRCVHCLLPWCDGWILVPGLQWEGRLRSTTSFQFLALSRLSYSAFLVCWIDTFDHVVWFT